MAESLTAWRKHRFLVQITQKAVGIIQAWRDDIINLHTRKSEVVEFSGDAVGQLLTPVLRGAEQQHSVAIPYRLITQAHYVVVITLK